MDRLIKIQIIVAYKDFQDILTLEVPLGITLEKLLNDDELLIHFSSNDISRAKIGLWGELIGLDYILKDGDRLEILRPLKNNPKDLRRKLADIGEHMGIVKNDC